MLFLGTKGQPALLRMTRMCGVSDAGRRDRNASLSACLSARGTEGSSFRRSALLNLSIDIGSFDTANGKRLKELQGAQHVARGGEWGAGAPPSKDSTAKADQFGVFQC
jgi:hypothetical protein